MYICPILKLHFDDANGAPLANGVLKTYNATTSEPVQTYQDESGDTLNETEITLDSRGECSVWLDASIYYLFKLYDSTGSLIYTVNRVHSGYSTDADSVLTIVTSNDDTLTVTKSESDGNYYYDLSIATQLSNLKNEITEAYEAADTTIKNSITALQNSKQDKLTAGNGISLNGSTISNANTFESSDGTISIEKTTNGTANTYDLKLNEESASNTWVKSILSYSNTAAVSSTVTPTNTKSSGNYSISSNAIDTSSFDLMQTNFDLVITPSDADSENTIQDFQIIFVNNDGTTIYSSEAFPLDLTRIKTHVSFSALLDVSTADTITIKFIVNAFHGTITGYFTANTEVNIGISGSGSSSSAWDDITDKPFSTIGSGLTVTNDVISADTQTGDHKVLVSSDDTEAAYLFDKLESTTLTLDITKDTATSAEKVDLNVVDTASGYPNSYEPFFPSAAFENINNDLISGISSSNFTRGFTFIAPRSTSITRLGIYLDGEPVPSNILTLELALYDWANTSVTTTSEIVVNSTNFSNLNSGGLFYLDLESTKTLVGSNFYTLYFTLKLSNTNYTMSTISGLSFMEICSKNATSVQITSGVYSQYSSQNFEGWGDTSYSSTGCRPYMVIAE